MKTVTDTSKEIVNVIRVVGEYPDGPEVAVVEAWRIHAILEATSRRMEGNSDNSHELNAALIGVCNDLKAALQSSVAVELSRRLGKEGRRYVEFGD